MHDLDYENLPAEKLRAKAARNRRLYRHNTSGGGLLEIDEEPSPPNSSENKTGFFLASDDVQLVGSDGTVIL